MTKTKLCKRCGAQMKLLDEDEQRWYCTRDDLSYLGNQRKWSDEVTKTTINRLGYRMMYLAGILGILYTCGVGIALIYYGIVLGRVLSWFLVLLIIFVLGYFLHSYHRWSSVTLGTLDQGIDTSHRRKLTPKAVSRKIVALVIIIIIIIISLIGTLMH